MFYADSESFFDNQRIAVLLYIVKGGVDKRSWKQNSKARR